MNTIEFYGRKGQQHLRRVHASHVIGLRAIADGVLQSDGQLRHELGLAFDDGRNDTPSSKLQAMLHEIHLVALKSTFELYLNRTLSSLWFNHFEILVERIPNDPKLSPRELARRLTEDSGPGIDPRLLIIDEFVPSHRLWQMVKLLKAATDIDLPPLLETGDRSDWSQIRVAFSVRHLVEHRDGKADRQFREQVKSWWGRSTWGKRTSLNELVKVDVEEEDVTVTCEAMLRATDSLTKRLLKWGSDMRTSSGA